MLEDDAYTYAYDLKGNRTSRTSKASGEVETYTYDSQNRLVGYASPSTMANYVYDAIERRVAKTVSGEQTAYIYDISVEGELNQEVIVLEWNTSGFPVLTRRWLHSNSIDEPIGFEDYVSSSGAGNGSERIMFADREGSIAWIVAPDSNEVIATYEYDGFGKLEQTSGSILQPFGYTGRQCPSSGFLGPMAA